MQTEATKRLVKSGILPKDYKDDLDQDFTDEYFGGIYEYIISDDDIEMYFPKCCSDQVAYIHTSIDYEGFSLRSLNKMFAAFSIPKYQRRGEDFRRSLLSQSNFEPVENAKMGATHFIGNAGGMLWSIFLDSEGKVLRVDGHDIKLVRDNDEQTYFQGPDIIEQLRHELESAERRSF
jgi:hypothetical protein